MTPAQRVLRAKLASHTFWAETADPADRAKHTAKARRASPVSIEYWIDQVRAKHPELGHEAVVTAATHAHKAEMTRRALLSSQSRARKKTASA